MPFCPEIINASKYRLYNTLIKTIALFIARGKSGNRKTRIAEHRQPTSSNTLRLHWRCFAASCFIRTSDSRPATCEQRLASSDSLFLMACQGKQDGDGYILPHSRFIALRLFSESGVFVQKQRQRLFVRKRPVLSLSLDIISNNLCHASCTFCGDMGFTKAHTDLCVSQTRMRPKRRLNK
jgi:hypothetical protein